VRFAPRDLPGLSLGLHLSASVVKSLAGLVFYFRHLATPGDLIIIDEPELNLHPDSQRKVTQILARAVRRGFKVMISTHSDYVIREIDHLIMLSKLSPEEAADIEYDSSWALDPGEVGVYLFDQGRIRPIEVEETGFSVQTIDAEINRMQETSQRFYAKLSR
jgi:energy-coupling factor transporter ATP-binding protein EcfA2